MKVEKMISRVVRNLFVVLLMFGTVLGLSSTTAYAETGKTDVVGLLYEFDKDSSYEFSESKDYVSTDEVDTYGEFSVRGNISDVSTKGDVPSYKISDGGLEFYYNYGDDLLLNADKDTWHLIEDKSKKIDNLKLDEKIFKGAMILQTSNDRTNWVDVKTLTNAFSETPVRTETIYKSTDVQLINGCYYRLIVAYELRIRTEDTNILFVNTDKYDYKKCVEVYEFYACSEDANVGEVDTNQTYSLGNKVKVADFDSYSGEETIKKGDLHYGWDLGEFFVSGYTADTKDSNGNVVFLKNVGDKVTLWFRLEEDIAKLNGDKDLKITADEGGSDQYFETPVMNFGKGTLIIRYTDHNNVKAEPTIYTNYLEANTSVGADTKVQLFEEGDYEVALDYQITDNRLIDKTGHYRIFFKFSIRNGNCMVYPFDVVTGSELTNSSMTENGFRLDLAKSRYLNVNLKREILAESADGLIEDTRFNGPAKDGAEYTDEGIYTITVGNEYTGQFTVKKIYVGSDSLMKAYMTTGLSISEIKDLLDEGATISEDGNIILANSTNPDSEPVNPGPVVDEPTLDNPSINQNIDEKKEGSNGLLPVVVAIILVGIAVAVVFRKKKNVKRKVEELSATEEDNK